MLGARSRERIFSHRSGEIRHEPLSLPREPRWAGQAQLVHCERSSVPHAHRSVRRRSVLARTGRLPRRPHRLQGSRSRLTPSLREGSDATVVRAGARHGGTTGAAATTPRISRASPRNTVNEPRHEASRRHQQQGRAIAGASSCLLEEPPADAPPLVLSIHRQIRHIATVGEVRLELRRGERWLQVVQHSRGLRAPHAFATTLFSQRSD